LCRPIATTRPKRISSWRCGKFLTLNGKLSCCTSWGELTFSQIAAVLDISANTVASRFRYALAKLRELMQVTETFHATS
jgi:hypothetical protein